MSNTYYFAVVDNADTMDPAIYSIEAESLDSAKEIFIEKFVPLIEGISFNDIADVFNERLDINILYFGNKLTPLT